MGETEYADGAGLIAVASGEIITRRRLEGEGESGTGDNGASVS
eukprot:CAMPEP_0184987564 /NCGR_PEP_ID=MMETSP1098-20130426/21143_1 /TAXON_ID=89044 /ORGANISM="Spumella elongata, Strain CCAP 955/1" /LENGTH=42 /DNA_ID= /DNA_START= /DNA_END= /DNA_ORIENTATION=